MPYLAPTFGLLEDEEADYDYAATAILPVPFERTTSYGKGTVAGPAAILRASHAVELYDEETGSEPWRTGIATLPAFQPEAFELAAALGEIQQEARQILADGKFLVTLGGEHSLTLAPVRAAADVFDGPQALGVVQLDAHADLRDSYDGTEHSHAAVMRRVLEDGHPILPVGIRSLSAPEAALIRERSLPVLWAHEMAADPKAAADRFTAELDRLPRTVYLTIDVDFLDPSLVPSTGTPEPGGGAWYPTLGLLRQVFARKRVVAMDLVELAPRGDHPASDFLVAKLLYKCLAYRQLTQSS